MLKISAMTEIYINAYKFYFSTVNINVQKGLYMQINLRQQSYMTYVCFVHLIGVSSVI